MNRREFITLLGSAVAWPLAARAQQGERMRRIGVLSALPENDSDTKARLAAFRQRLEVLGWAEGRNLHLDYRFTSAGSTLQALAKELIALRPDVLFAISTPMAAALKDESLAIPIVFVNVSDPIGSGFIASLARPGGNLTGVLMYEEGIVGKWLAMLKEIAPGLGRVGLLASPKTTPFDYFLRSAAGLAQSLAIEIVPAPIDNAADIERSIVTLVRGQDSGLVVLPDNTANVHRALIITLAARHRLPAVYASRAFVTAGGLMSYGIDQIEAYRRSASYVDRILRGTKPADLPVEAPTKYETILNVKTAKALGLTVPPGLLVAADEVIE